MVDLCDMHTKACLLIKEYKIELKQSPHWNYKNFQKLALISTIIAVVGLIFVQFSVFIAGAAIGMGSALIAYKIKCKIQNEIILIFERVIKELKKNTTVPKIDITTEELKKNTTVPKIDTTFAAQLSQRDQKIEELEANLEKLRSEK